MAEVQEILNMITQMGFPVFACIIIYQNGIKQSEMWTTQLEKMKDTINENTAVIREIKEVIRIMGVDNDDST